MQAVILLAGRSTRTYPLTLTRPKPLLPVANKPIILHTLDALKGLVDEVILVVGYKGTLIQAFLGEAYGGMTLTYVEQQEQQGTAHALAQAKPHVTGKFLLLLGDNLYPREAIEECLKHDLAILTTTVPDPEHYGVITEKGGVMQSIEEKPEEFVSDQAVVGVYVLDQDIFTIMDSLEKTERGELELPDALRELSKQRSIRCVSTENVHFIGYPWDLLKADRALRNGGNLIGKSSKVAGEVTDSSIGENCIIEGTVKDSIIMDRTKVEKGSMIASSVLGTSIEFSGTIEAGETTSMVKGKPMDAGIFGAAIGDNVKARDVVMRPGVKVWPGKGIKGSIAEDRE